VIHSALAETFVGLLHLPGQRIFKWRMTSPRKPAQKVS